MQLRWVVWFKFRAIAAILTISSSAMTLLLNEERELDFGEEAMSTASADNGEDHPPEGPHHQDRTARPPPPRRRRDANQFFFDFLMLQKFDFTRDIIVLIERAGITGADMYEHIPLRNILDSGSKESFINRKILTEYSMDPAKIRHLSDDEQSERTVLTMSGSPLTPTHEVTLYWHRLKDTTQRRARFLVVENDNFDVLIGSALWSATEGPSRGYLALPGYQSWSMCLRATDLEGITNCGLQRKEERRKRLRRKRYGRLGRPFENRRKRQLAVVRELHLQLEETRCGAALNVQGNV